MELNIFQHSKCLRTSNGLQLVTPLISNKLQEQSSHVFGPGAGRKTLLILLSLLLLGADASLKNPKAPSIRKTAVKLHTAILRDIPHRLTGLDFLFFYFEEIYKRF